MMPSCLFWFLREADGILGKTAESWRLRALLFRVAGLEIFCIGMRRNLQNSQKKTRCRPFGKDFGDFGPESAALADYQSSGLTRAAADGAVALHVAQSAHMPRHASGEGALLLARGSGASGQERPQVDPCPKVVVMKKTTRWVCAVALGLALWGPAAHADDGANVWAFFEALLEQIEEILVGPGPDAGGDALTEERPPGELGVLLPPGG